MGLRDKWEFKYTARKLAEAARRKLQHHRERLKFWEDAKAKVMTEVRETGIEVSESVAGASYSNSTRTHGPQVMVRTDLQTRLSECHGKILEHNAKVAEYVGWVEVLDGNPDNQLTLNADDYLFFFGAK
jgi:hypothetical protein